jgi:hypothetical protein
LHHTGDLTLVVVVTDNGPAYRSIGFATPISRYLQAPSTPPGPTLKRPQLSQILDAGQATVLARQRARDMRFSITVRQTKPVRAAIAAIVEAAWVDFCYRDPGVAKVAETPFRGDRLTIAAVVLRSASPAPVPGAGWPGGRGPAPAGSAPGCLGQGRGPAHAHPARPGRRSERPPTVG